MGVRKRLLREPRAEEPRIPARQPTHMPPLVSYLFSKEGPVECLGGGNLAKNYPGRRILLIPENAPQRIRDVFGTGFRKVPDGAHAVEDPAAEEIAQFKHDVHEAAKTDYRIEQLIRDNIGAWAMLHE